MKRRQFLGALGLGGAALATGSWLRSSPARGLVPVNDRNVVVNITLRGGPDFRHMLAPPFAGETSGYPYAYWSNRWRSHGLTEAPADWQKRFAEGFTPVESGGQQFGILNQAGWLQSQFAQGNVAIVNNVAGAVSRDHHHAELIYESGVRATTANDLTRDGWGGRLAQTVGGRVVSMTSPVRLFCNGTHPSDPRRHDNSHVITAANTRDIALFKPEVLATEPASASSQAILSRGLSSYYAALRDEIGKDSPYYPILEHEQTIRGFGEQVQERLGTVPLPASIAALYEGDNTLDSAGFGRQVRNLYDSFACSDIFNFRVGSLMYNGFDTHRDQLSTIEPKFNDLFGTGRGLDTLYTELAAAMPDALDNLVLVVGGEFGRQLAANGDQGTDHGRGNTMFVIGRPVTGGVYGDLFPETEVPRFTQESSADIAGQTSIEHVFSSVCDWLDPGSGATVLPPQPGAALEAGVSLEQLLTT